MTTPPDNHAEPRGRWVPAANAIVWLLVGAVVLGAVWTLFAIRGTQTGNTETLQAANHSGNLIEDCVKPTGKCFKRGERRTAKAVGQILLGFRDLSVDAAACAAIETQKPGAMDLTVGQLATRIRRCLAELAPTPKR